MVESMSPDARRAAAKIIEEKRDLLLAERNQLAKERQELLDRTRRNDRELADCKAAARLFDLNIEFPMDEREEMERHLMVRRAEMERETARRREHHAAMEAAKAAALAEAASRIAKAITPVIDVKPNEMPPKVAITSKKGRPPLRVIVLEQLNSAGEKGAKAATIRDFIERTYGNVLHEKTVGMTLYRLLKENLARRDGHVWFAANAGTGNGNPDVAAPGH